MRLLSEVPAGTAKAEAGRYDWRTNREASMGKWLVIGLIALIAALVGIESYRSRNPPIVVEFHSDPADMPSGPATPSAWDSPNDARRVIEVCWEDQKRKSLDPATQRFVASVCEGMEAKFVSKFGRKP